MASREYSTSGKSDQGQCGPVVASGANTRLQSNGQLIIAPLMKPKVSLASLLSQVTENNRHHKVDTGPAVGGRNQSS